MLCWGTAQPMLRFGFVFVCFFVSLQKQNFIVTWNHPQKSHCRNARPNLPSPSPSPTVNTRSGSVDLSLCRGENEASWLNLSDRPALFTQRRWEAEGVCVCECVCGRGSRLTTEKEVRKSGGGGGGGMGLAARSGRRCDFVGRVGGTFRLTDADLLAATASSETQRSGWPALLPSAHSWFTSNALTDAEAEFPTLSESCPSRSTLKGRVILT